jgi:pimeloyl-ACP methyl ester carboxylesterase
LAQQAVAFTKQAEKLSLRRPESQVPTPVAVKARFVTPQDPVIETTDGHRLPAVPLEEAHKLNLLHEELQARPARVGGDEHGENPSVGRSGTSNPKGDDANVNADTDGIPLASRPNRKTLQKNAEGTLKRSMPPSSTNPLFPPLPLWGPPTFLRNIQCTTFRVSSFFLSLAFLAVIVLGALFTSMFYHLTCRDIDANRPFFDEEARRQKSRTEQERAWRRRQGHDGVAQDSEGSVDEFPPTEGGRDPIVCDVAYYARRVGLDMEEFQVQTEDGFIIDLWHIYDPKEYSRLPDEDRRHGGPDPFRRQRKTRKSTGLLPKFPVLLMHGLLQSAGAYCVNDDDSLAFYLCKAGFDVWLGNNRCGFKPKHTVLVPSDPRMWCWNIRQMGVMDLTALTSRVTHETGFEKIALVCHSQGTTQALVALAKEQRPDLGQRLTVFCALAPAAYAGPLIGKMYFKFMRVISPALFRLMFGIHAFIPFMMTMHSWLPPHLYGWLGYKVFWFLFNWSDQRWDRSLRNRMFQFAPVYVSAESMRWWLGRECFAHHKCILSTKEAVRAEEKEDELHAGPGAGNDTREEDKETLDAAEQPGPRHRRQPAGSTAWYDHKAPPFAFWVAGNDDLVDGTKFLRRFERGREPHVKVVHSKVIPDYEHLDVIWAMSAVDEVFREVKEVMWKTCNARHICRVPSGCDSVPEWAPQQSNEVSGGDDQSQSSSSDE